MGAGELCRNRLAEDHRAGRPQDRHRRRIRRRPVARVDRRAHLRRHVGGIENVLDADRHAVERPHGLRGGIAGARPGEHKVWIEEGPGPDCFLALGDAREAGTDHGLRGRAAVRDRPRGLGGAGRHLSRNASISGFC